MPCSLGTIGFYAVKHLLLCRIERRPPRLDMQNYPPPAAGTGTTTKASDYMALLGGGVGMSSTNILLCSRRGPILRSCSNIISRHCVCPPSCASTTGWRGSAPSNRIDYPRYLLRMAELSCSTATAAPPAPHPASEFPVVKSLDSFDFLAIPALNKAMVLELARWEFLGAARTYCCWVTPEPVRHISRWPSAWPPASMAIACASPPQPRWSMS